VTVAYTTTRGMTQDGFSPTVIALEAACEFAYQCVRCAVGALLRDHPLVEFLKGS
jgi:hypothetical protein